MKNKKIEYSLLFFGSFIFLTFIQLMFFGDRLDYYWNFNNSLQINNGLLPYKDINIITTPLFHFITSLFLQIFGKNIIAYASLMSILDILFIFVLSKITSILLNNKNKGINITFYFLIMTLMYVFYFEYNYLACFFVLLIIIIELKNKDKPYTSFLLGILASLSLLSKQSIGLFTVLFVIFKPLLFKENKKMILYRFLGVLVPVTIFFIYLLCSNTLSDFISYCILGLKEFNNSITIFDIIRIGDKLLYSVKTIIIYIISFTTIFIYVYKYFKKMNSKKINIFLYYIFICFVCVYPIMDMHHIMPGFLSTIPLLFLFFNNLVKKYKSKINAKYLLLIKRCLISAIAIVPFIVFNMYFNIYNNNDKMYVILKNDYNSLNGIAVKKNLKEKIDMVISYEKDMAKEGYKSIMLNKEGVIYHMAQDIYYKDYDLFMRGNFGENGNKRLLKDIEESKNTLYLIDLYDYITKDQRYNQIPFDIIEYVIDNYENMGTINLYTVYYNNK